MTLLEEARRLRRQLGEWAIDPEWSLLVRYELQPHKPPQEWQRRFRQRIGRWLRVLGFDRSHYLKQAWHSGLKHANCTSGARTLLIWAEGADVQHVRESCKGLQRLLSGREDLLPVLVTDVADFAFYSRLGWLVEYLPDLSGDGASYRDRKRRYLAWRYRNALAVPVSAGLASQAEWDALLGLGDVR